MKINGVQVEEHGSGYSVTIRAHVGREEARVGMSDAVTSTILTGMVAGFAAISELELRDTPAPAPAGPTTVPTEAPAQPAPAPATRRSRRGEAQQAKADPAPAPAANERRSRRGEVQQAKADPTPAPAASAPIASRRGHSTQVTAQPAVTHSSPDAKIADEDLTKAASQAAMVLGAPAVMEIVKEFGVDQVGQLKADVRQEFLDRLKAEREAVG